MPTLEPLPRKSWRKEQSMSNTPIIMTEEYWANSHLSIARYYGRIRFSGVEYVIVNKEEQINEEEVTNE